MAKHVLLPSNWLEDVAQRIWESARMYSNERVTGASLNSSHMQRTLKRELQNAAATLALSIVRESLEEAAARVRKAESNQRRVERELEELQGQLERRVQMLERLKRDELPAGNGEPKDCQGKRKDDDQAKGVNSRNQD